MSDTRTRHAFAAPPIGWARLLLTTILPSAVIPVALAVFFEFYLSVWRWTSEPFHALVEGVGSVAAVMLATFILIMRRSGQLRPGYLWVATTLIGMGLLDGFHAGVHPGPAFVWLHSLATLLGGLTFALVVLSDRVSSRPGLQAIPYLMAAASVSIGIASVLAPDQIPIMVKDHGFTLTAELLNIVGGLGFVIAWMHFTWSGRYENSGERLVLANHCLLFGMAGLLFHFSVLWDATWWLWHLLRLLAYLVILWFFLTIFHRDMELIRRQRDELRLAQQIVDQSGEAIVVTDTQNRIVAVNDAYVAITGYPREEVIGATPSKTSSGRHDAAFYQEMWSTLLSRGQWAGEIWDRRKNGEVYPKWLTINAITDEQGRTSHYVGIFSDITERKDTEEKITYLAHHDKLTGLFNRHSLQDRLSQALATAQRVGMPLAVMFIDMDRFKLINDTLGHHIGDCLLVEVAQRLRTSVRESDIVARLGGDEFVVVLTGMDAASDAMMVSRKVLGMLAQPYEIEGNLLHSTPSIGISVFPNDAGNVEILMQNADTAMYHAKALGRNNIQFFTTAMNVAAVERMELERDLRSALDRNQLELHYQLQVCTRSNQARGVEALLRWQHPEHGMISPLRFIPIAEESGLIEPLGNWVLKTACRQIADWRARGIRGLRMAVNLSAHQLRSPRLVDQVSAIIRQYGIQAGELELEITESAAMSDPQRAIEILQALRELCIQLTIDDFGTGYSSLAYLKQLPVHCLKIDRSFVKDIEHDKDDASICLSILALAHSLDLEVVAEGVETETQRDFLVRNKCDYLQGYLLAKPEPAERCYALLQSLVAQPAPA